MDNHILLVICVASLLLSISVVNASEENGKDEVKNAFGSFLDEAKEALGPVSSWDLRKVKDTFSPSLEEAEEALGPISSLDQVREALSPLSSSIIHEAKDAISPSAKSEASKHIDSITSWLSQKELGPTPFSSLDKEEDEQNEEESSSDSFEEAQKELGPISSSDLDKEDEGASTPVSSPSTVNQAFDVAKQKLGSLLSQSKEEIFSDSPSNLDEAYKELGPISSDQDASPSTFNEAKEALGSLSPQAFDMENEKLGSIRSLLSQNKEESPSILDEAPFSSSGDLDKNEDTSSPISSSDEPEEAFAPVSPSTSNSNEALDDVEETPITPFLSQNKEEIFSYSPSILDEAQKEKLGNEEEISSDSPSNLNEAQEELSPISSSDDVDKDEDASSPISSLDEPEEASAPISPSTSKEAFDDAKEIFSQNKEEIFSDSLSVLDEAQKELGPISSSDLDKDEDASGPISSPVPPSNFNEAKEALGSISSQALNVAKEKIGKIRSLLTQNKEEMSSDPPSNLDKAQEELSAISSSGDLDKDEDASSPVSSLDEAEEAVAPVLSSISNEAKEALGSISPEAVEGSFGPIASLISQNKEEISSDSSSILEEAQKELGPISSFDFNKDEEEAFSPISPSSSDEEKGSISSEALDENSAPIPAQMKVQIPSKSSISPIYFDHDVALAIESLIKQGQSNSQLAIEEADKLLSDANFSQSKTGKCVKKCKNNYASCLDKLHKAMEDLRARNAELLTDDVSAVEGDISACQKCFLENQSPLKDLEEATIKATRECLNVLHHSS